MRFFLVNLICPNGHPVAGRPKQYASDDPPEAWLSLISREFFEDIRSVDVPPCAGCGAKWSHSLPRPELAKWSVSVDATHATSQEDLAAALARCAELIEPRTVE